MLKLEAYKKTFDGPEMKPGKIILINEKEGWWIPFQLYCYIVWKVGDPVLDEVSERFNKFLSDRGREPFVTPQKIIDSLKDDRNTY
jgi:hypothetical protein